MLHLELERAELKMLIDMAIAAFMPLISLSNADLPFSFSIILWTTAAPAQAPAPEPINAIVKFEFANSFAKSQSVSNGGMRS